MTNKEVTELTAEIILEKFNKLQCTGKTDLVGRSPQQQFKDWLNAALEWGRQHPKCCKDLAQAQTLINDLSAENEALKADRDAEQRAAGHYHDKYKELKSQIAPDSGVYFFHDDSIVPDKLIANYDPQGFKYCPVSDVLHAIKNAHALAIEANSLRQKVLLLSEAAKPFAELCEEFQQFDWGGSRNYPESSIIHFNRVNIQRQQLEALAQALNTVGGEVSE